MAIAVINAYLHPIVKRLRVLSGGADTITVSCDNELGRKFGRALGEAGALPDECTQVTYHFAQGEVLRATYETAMTDDDIAKVMAGLDAFDQAQ